MTTTTAKEVKCLRCGGQIPHEHGIHEWVACPTCGEEWLINDTLKRHLLAHYEQKEPTEFRQLDCFLGEPNNRDDCVIQFDGEGHSVFTGQTTELMHGVGVRALVNMDVSASEAASALRKLADTVEDGFHD